MTPEGNGFPLRPTRKLEKAYHPPLIPAFYQQMNFNLSLCLTLAFAGASTACFHELTPSIHSRTINQTTYAFILPYDYSVGGDLTICSIDGQDPQYYYYCDRGIDSAAGWYQIPAGPHVLKLSFSFDNSGQKYTGGGTGIWMIYNVIARYYRVMDDCRLVVKPGGVYNLLPPKLSDSEFPKGPEPHSFDIRSATPWWPWYEEVTPTYNVAQSVWSGKNQKLFWVRSLNSSQSIPNPR